jgi:hypothetical protein
VKLLEHCGELFPRTQARLRVLEAFKIEFRKIHFYPILFAPFRTYLNAEDITNVDIQSSRNWHSKYCSLLNHANAKPFYELRVEVDVTRNFHILFKLLAKQQKYSLRWLRVTFFGPYTITEKSVLTLGLNVDTTNTYVVLA